MPSRGNNGNHGKKGRSGRKSKAEELGLERLLSECWTDAQRRDCITNLAEDCQSDDFKIRHESRKLLLAYAFGKPKERHDVTLFDYSDDDLRLLNDYELQRIIAGDDAESVFATARARRIRETAKAE